MILLTYLLLQTGKLKSTDIRYSIFNALGAGLILISLRYNFNLSAVIIEGFWVVISLVGIFRCLKEKRRKTGTGPS